MTDLGVRMAEHLKAGEAEPAAACASATRWVASPDELERDAGLHVLAEWGDARYAYLALARLDDPSPPVVAEALRCIATWRIRGAVERVALLVDSDTTVVSSFAIWCLGMIGDAETHLPRMKEIVAENDGTLQAIAAAESWWRLAGGEPSCEAYVLSKLAAADPELRAFAASSLVGMVTDANHDSIVARLTEALHAERNAAIAPSLERALDELR